MPIEPRPSISLDEKKLNIEMEKLSLEQRKFKLEASKASLAAKSYRIDLWSKLAIPVAVFVLAAATYYTNSSNMSDRMVFDADNKKVEFRQKEEELFIKKSESEQNREANKARFIQNNLELITAPAPESEQRLAALANAVLPAIDVHEVLEKAKAIRVSSTPQEVITDKASPLNASSEYLNTGKIFAKSGNFEQALTNFEMATLLNTSDPLAWNYKAYAEMRTDRNDAALKSISTAINLKPVEASAQRIIMLNATKILCSLGRTEDALSYINKSIALSPEMYDLARKDQEFGKRCNFALRK